MKRMKEDRPLNGTLLVHVCISYQVLDAAQHRRGEDACEEGHEVQAGERPN